MSNEFYTLLGFAAKAGKCSYGAQSVEKGTKAGSILLILMDESASARTEKDMRNMCAYYKIPFIKISPAGRLAKACGRESNKIIGIIDKGFSERLLEIYNLSIGNCAEV